MATPSSDNEKLNLVRSYQNLKKYLHNAFWMMGDRAVSLTVGFFLAAMIARHLGPEDFGLLSYVMSLTAIFTAAGHMGLSGLVVREIVQRPEERALTLGTTVALKFGGMGVGYAMLLSYGAFYEGTASLTFALIALSGLLLFLTAFEIFELWFQAFVQARFVAIARLGSLGLGAGLKLALLFGGSVVTFFILANVFQAAAFVVLLFFLFVVRGGPSPWSWRFSFAKAKALLSQGWMIYLGSIFAVIYLKVDQVMLRWLATQEAVGIYAVASQLSEAWYFVPAAIVASVFPKLIAIREESEDAFKHRFQQLLDVLCALGFLVALGLTLLSDVLVTSIFGDAYADSAAVLATHVWASVFIAMRAAFSRWILIEGAVMFSMITQGAGAFINVGLNLWLIPNFGGMGAAVATLLAYAVASYASLACYPRTRSVFIMMSKSLAAPLRYTAAFAMRRARER